jgi:phosphopantothenoylcysteine decarboxylase/phosphopantothenate--cysteine ligase
LTEAGFGVRVILTRAGAQFVTPLSLSALTGERVYQDLFSLTDEAEMGHIQLSRSADLVVVAPATADLLARMAAGLASDLATTALLATDKPVLAAPAMNVRMWEHAATVANVALLRRRDIRLVGPEDGPMACGEYGPGRMAEPEAILAAIADVFAAGPLKGRRALVTSGPTHEPLDPVRYIANRSSGKQGHAIAAALAAQGADVTLVSGPTAEPAPPGARLVSVETAAEMLEACRAALPADIAVLAAAVGDWRPETLSASKLKKGGTGPVALSLIENADILATLSAPGPQRPALVIGFAAETEDVIANARAKRARKGCDWIVANDVSAGSGTFGGDENTVHLIGADRTQSWPRMAKAEVALRLATAIAAHFREEGRQ